MQGLEMDETAELGAWACSEERVSVEEVALEDLVAVLEETSDAYAFAAEGDSAFGRTDRTMAALVEESRRMKHAAME